MIHASGGLLLAALAGGILLGLVYAAMSMGLSLTMGVLGVVNVAHGAFVMLGALAVWTIFHRFGIDPLIGMLLVIPVFFAIGAVLERLLIEPVIRASDNIGLLILFGLMVLVEAGSILVWTTDLRGLPVRYAEGAIAVGPLRLGTAKLLGGGFALAVAGILDVFLRRTMAGKGIRAMAMNRDAAQLMGMDVRRLSMLVFGLGTAVTAVGGLVLALIFPFAPQDQIRWLAWAFLVVILGGLGDVRRTLLAGIVVGLVESLSALLVPFAYVYVVIYGLLALTLLFRTQGLAGSRSRAV